MKPFHSLLIGFLRLIFKIFYRLKVYGREHYIKGGAILACNHISYLDPPIVAVASPERIHFLARETLFRSLFGRFITAFNAHPVQGDGSNFKVMKMICELLKKGFKVLLFPEGTRSEDNKIRKIKPGVALLLSRSKTAIIPVYIYGTFKIWPRNRKFPRLFGQTAVIFGSPIEWKDYVEVDKKQVQEQITARLSDALEALRVWHELGAQGTPP